MKPINQTLLTLIIASVMILGFVGVYAIGYQYESTAIPETLFVSDSNTEFGMIDFNALVLPAYYPAIYQPMYYGKVSPLGNWIQSNITMVYTGNNTWGGAVNQQTGAFYESQVYIPIKLDIAKTSLFSSIQIKMNLPGDADISTDVMISSIHNPVVLPGDSGYYTTIQPITPQTPSATTYNQTFPISTYQALKIYSDANANPEPYITIRIIDNLENGISAYNLNMTVEIIGTSVSTWSLQDSVNIVIGGAVVGNFVVGAFMLDSVDFRGYVKTLPGKSGNRKKGKR